MVFDPKKEWLPVFPFPASPRHQNLVDTLDAYRFGDPKGNQSSPKKRHGKAMKKTLGTNGTTRSPGPLVPRCVNQIVKSLGSQQKCLAKRASKPRRSRALTSSSISRKRSVSSGSSFFTSWRWCRGWNHKSQKNWMGLLRTKKWGKNHAIKINVYTGPGFFFL